MELIEIFQEFDAVIAKETAMISDYITNTLSYESTLFDQPFIMENDKRPEALRGRKGVYIFILTADVRFEKRDVSEWRKVRGAGLNNELKKEYRSGDCLYVGSCQSQSLYTRIRQHFAEKGDFTALKLRDPRRMIMYGKTKAFIFPIKQEYKEYNRIILTSIERKLHNHFSPLAGGSKV